MGAIDSVRFEKRETIEHLDGTASIICTRDRLGDRDPPSAHRRYYLTGRRRAQCTNRCDYFIPHHRHMVAL